jgi:hypothetical protein
MVGYYQINPAGNTGPEDAFGPRFFKTRFYTWIREACAIDNSIPVLELLLTSGQVLDVSHIVDLKEDYMLLCAFTDVRDCSETYHTYVRYQTIFGINVLTKSSSGRSMGFNMDKEPHLIQAESRDRVAAETAEEYTKRTERAGGNGKPKPKRKKTEPVHKAK